METLTFLHHRCTGKWLSTSTASIRGVTVGNDKAEKKEADGGMSQEEWELGLIQALFVGLSVSADMKKDVEDACRLQYGSPHGVSMCLYVCMSVCVSMAMSLSLC